MHYIVIPSKKLVVGWNQKCGCSTMKAVILKDLGLDKLPVEYGETTTFALLKRAVGLAVRLHPRGALVALRKIVSREVRAIKNRQVEDAWHLRMRSAISDSAIPLYHLGYVANHPIDDFSKVCVVRNPYERLISGIRHRFSKPFLDSHNLPKGLLKNLIATAEMTVDEYVLNLQQNDFFPDKHHFKPQTFDLDPRVEFDKVYDMKDMGAFIDDHFAGQVNRHYALNVAVHITKYSPVRQNYRGQKIKDIVLQKAVSRNPHDWFSDTSIKIINELYKGDFEFCEKHGIKYEML